MRKYLVLVIVAAIMVMMPISSYAAGQDSRDELVVVDGTTQEELSVEAVNLMFGYQDVLTDVPSLLLENRTLVPIRFIVENLGAEISWNQELRQATITTEEKEIVLTIDKKIALVNGEEVELPSGVPAKLLGYNGNFRTMVPFRFVSEQLGLDVGWIGETMTATIDYPEQSIEDVRMEVVEGIPKMVIDLSGKVNYREMYLEAMKLGINDRLILDFPNTKMNVGTEMDIMTGYYQKPINQNGILKIRLSQFETEPRLSTRLVIDLEMQSGYSIEYDENKNIIYVSFVNHVNEIYTDYLNFIDIIKIETDETPMYNIRDYGDKIAIDIMDSVLNMDASKGPVKVDNDVIKQVRFAQFKPDDNYEPDDKIVRVVLDLQPGKTLDNVYVDYLDNNIIVYMNSNPMDQLQYELFGLKDSKLTMLLDRQGESVVVNKEADNEIVVKISKDLMELPDEVKLEMSDDIIEYIEVDGSQSYDDYYIIIKYENETRVSIEEGNGVSDKVIINFNTSKEVVVESKYENKLVVIDPGHGGKDPGAMANNLKEKDLNLETAFKLKKLLEDVGFKVYLTRDTDVYVGLYERAERANAMDADLFISIHYNAINKANVSGVEVLYDGTYESTNKRKLAQIIQNEMVKTLNAINRGLLNKPKYIVVRETDMPSALAELGFITNYETSQKLKTDDYKQKCAQALFNGIVKYFETY